MMELVKDHLEIILNVSPKYYGAVKIKFIVVPKIKRFIVLIPKEI